MTTKKSELDIIKANVRRIMDEKRLKAKKLYIAIWNSGHEISEKSLRDLLKGVHRTMHDRTLEAIAAGLGVTVDELKGVKK
jgi:hypothetical protein